MSKKPFKEQRVEAARKAVHTLRLRLLTKANIDELQQLCNDIIGASFQLDDDFTREAIIAREVQKTTWKSFCRFGNRSNATKALILQWIDNKGAALDEQAIYISEQYSMEILPDELAEFIMFHDRGKCMYEPYSRLEELKQAFRDMAGFCWNKKFVDQFILTNGNRCLQDTSDDMPF